MSKQVWSEFSGSTSWLPSTVDPGTPCGSVGLMAKARARRKERRVTGGAVCCGAPVSRVEPCPYLSRTDRTRWSSSGRAEVFMPAPQSHPAVPKRSGLRLGIVDPSMDRGPTSERVSSAPLWRLSPSVTPAMSSVCGPLRWTRASVQNGRGRPARPRSASLPPSPRPTQVGGPSLGRGRRRW